MKRIKLALTVLAVFPILIYSQGIWVPFTANVPGTPPTIEVLTSNSAQTVIHVTIPGMWVEDTLIGGVTYQIVRLPSHSTLGNVGAPQLPAIRKLVAIPPISDVNITIATGTPLLLSGYTVYPFQAPVPVGQPYGPFFIDSLIYSANISYPQNQIEMSDPAILRDVRVVNTMCCPIAFNPVTHTLSIYHDFTIRLDYRGTNTTNSLPCGYPPAVNTLFAAMYKSLIINYDRLGILTERSSVLDYLVITATDYYDYLQDFVFWKHKKGLNIKVARPMDIVRRPYFVQEDTAAIRNYIHDQFGAWDRLAYVLLIGDEAEIPMFIGWFNPATQARIYSDHYYACLGGHDYLPDIAVGRLSVANGNDVTTIVNKIFAYEREPAQDWAIGRVLMVSHWVQAFHDLNDTIVDDFLEPNGFACYDAWGKLSYSNEHLKNYIENCGPVQHGVSIVNYCGHGQPMWWDDWNMTENFETSDVHDLTNTNLYPIVYNCCCLNGAIQAPSEVMVEAWIRDPNGGGVGALGASEEVIDYPPELPPIPYDLFEATFNENIYDVGYAVNYAKICLIQEYGEAGLANARMYNWFGDPELSIWTCASGCSTGYVTHPTLIGTEPTDFEVTVENEEFPGPVEWALVCLYKDETPELWQISHTNSAGIATFSIDPVYGGDLHVTVTKQNYLPYEGVCRVSDSEGGPQTTDSRPSCPTVYALNQNVPNPFSNATTIPYQIPAKGDNKEISVDIYDINGTYLKTLVKQKQGAGYYTVAWDGRDDGGDKLPAGVYFVRLTTGDYTSTEKILLIK